MPTRASHRLRRGRRRLALIAAGSLALLLALLAYALFQTPDWYRPPRVAPEDYQKVRDNLVVAEHQFTESLLAEEPFEYHVFQDVLNQWIAARREIFPLIDEFLPPVLEDPFIRIDENGITLAGRYSMIGLGAIVSVDIEPTWEGDALTLRARSVRCGSLSLSPDFGGLGLARSAAFASGELWPGSPQMAGDLLTGFRIGARAWWKNGGVDYRLTGVRLREGQLDLHIRPLDDQVAARRRHHRSSD